MTNVVNYVKIYHKHYVIKYLKIHLSNFTNSIGTWVIFINEFCACQIYYVYFIKFKFQNSISILSCSWDLSRILDFFKATPGQLCEFFSLIEEKLLVFLSAKKLWRICLRKESFLDHLCCVKSWLFSREQADSLWLMAINERFDKSEVRWIPYFLLIDLWLLTGTFCLLYSHFQV